MRAALLIGMCLAAAIWAQDAGIERTLAEGEKLQKQPSTRTEAIALFESARDAARRAGIARLEGRALYRIAQTRQMNGEHQLALNGFAEARDAAHRAGDRAGEASALHNLAAANWFLGEAERASDLYRALLPLRRELGDPAGLARTWYGVAAAHWSMGDAAPALDAYREALALWSKQKDANGEAETRNSLGLLYAQLGDFTRARLELDRALAGWRRLGNRNREAYTLNNLALAAIGQRSYSQAAQQCRRALELLATGEDRRARAYVLHNLGNARAGRGHHKQALEHFDASLAIKRDLHDRWGEAYTLHAMGESQSALRDYPRAAELLGQALALRVAVHDRTGRVLTLGAMAHLEESRHQREQALARITEAVVLIEQLRSDLQAQDLRASYLASQRDYYALAIRTLVALGRDAEALEWSERARGRLLLDRLGELAASIEASPALLAEEESLRRRIRAQSDRLQRLASAPGASDSRRMDELLAEHHDLVERMRRASPSLALLIEPPPVAAAGVQAELASGDLLLEFFTGEQASFAWLVTRGRIAAFPLPGRSELEAHTQTLAAAIAARGSWRQPADALSRAVLGPVAEAIRGYRPNRVIIAADAALESVPYAALSLPGDAEPLAARYEIARLPSSAALALHRGQPPPKHGKTLAIFGDPIFGASDERYSGITRAANGPELPRLRFAGEEAAAIAALEDPSRVTLATGTQAAAARIWQGALRGHRIVHFATHAVVDPAQPALSGLALSQVDARGRPVDGFLRLHEIFRLPLDASLVVVSACRSGLGAALPGEGLMSITRGFLHAGVRSVVATLWDVDDRATAELMTEFYQHLLSRGEPPAAALRAAQNAIRAESRWSHPYYWAGFSLHGEWRR